MKRKRNYARGLFGLLVVLLLGSLLLEPAGAQAPAEPGWEVFREPGFGFLIQYPAGWRVSLVADNTQRAQAYGEDVAMRSIGFFGPNSQIVFADVWINRSGISLTEWMQRYPAPITENPVISPTTEIATLAGEFALRQVAAPPTADGRSPWHYRTQLAHDDLILSLEYVALEPSLASYEQMLASFRFESPTRERLTPSTLSDALPPAEFGVMTADCCGIVDPEYNPFPCNTAGDSQCPFPPCGNCTWWVRYRRMGGSEANLVHCTGDAITWQGCANQFYPHLLSSDPDEEAVVLYSNLDHLSFVESVFGGNAYNASDLSWAAPCPANYFSSSAGGGKSFIQHPDNFTPNAPPNAPIPVTPADEAWLNSREVALTWDDGGDPDDGPQPERSFQAHIWQEGWTENSSWLSKTSWEVTLPQDGLYTWRVKAHDGMLESAWSTPRELGVDTVPPAVVMSPGQPATGRWYNTNQVVAWTVTDPDPGSGVNYFKWAWDDSTPDNQVNESQGSTNLSAAGQGMHYLYLQAWDKVGQASTVAQSGWFGYDTVAPNVTFSPQNPAVAQWYNSQPDLAWTVADPGPGSGVDYFQWTWDSPLPVQYNLTYNRIDGTQGSAPLNSAQGKHSLYVQAWDQAANPGLMSSLGWLGYDTLAPEPPSIDPGCEAANNQWQNVCRQPHFSWHSDETNPLWGRSSEAAGSGVVDYAYIWGAASAATPTGWSTVTAYEPDPVAEATGWGKAYLHVQARDAAGNISAPATFGLWYDGSIPTVAASIKVNAPDGSTVQLDLSAADSGSGPGEVRLANNDLTWSAWQPYAAQIDWALVAANNPTHTVYIQARDQAGNMSAIISETVILTVETGQSNSPEMLAVEPGANLFEPGWPSDPQPTLFAVSFADGQLFTNIPTTTVEIGAPDVTLMRLSAEATYVDQDWQPYQVTNAWLLAGVGDEVPPQRLYVWFRDAGGALYGPYYDEIIYDAFAPKGKIKILSADATTQTLLLNAWDDHSGVIEMRLAEDDSMMTAVWEPYTYTTVRPQTGQVTYVQFRDFAGNLSPIYGADGSDSSLTERLYLPVVWR